MRVWLRASVLHNRSMFLRRPINRLSMFVVEIEIVEAVRRTLEIIKERVHHRGEFYAMRRLVSVLERSLIVLDHEDPNILEALDDVAVLLARRGRLRRARAANSRAAAGLCRVLGPFDPVTLRAEAHRASLLSQSGDDAAAVELGMHVLAACKARLGDEHAQTLDLKAGLGLVVGRLGRLREAQDLQQEAYIGRLRLLGRGHPATVEVMTDLYMTLVELDDRGAAKRLLADVFEARKTLFKIRFADVDPVHGIGRFLVGNVEEMKEQQRLEAVLRTGEVPRSRAWLTSPRC